MQKVQKVTCFWNTWTWDHVENEGPETATSGAAEIPYFLWGSLNVAPTTTDVISGTNGPFDDNKDGAQLTLLITDLIMSLKRSVDL